MKFQRTVKELMAIIKRQIKKIADNVWSTIKCMKNLSGRKSPLAIEGNAQ